jgi:hypothetical protein
MWGYVEYKSPYTGAPGGAACHGFEPPEQQTFGTAHNRLIRRQMSASSQRATFQRVIFFCYTVLPVKFQPLIFSAGMHVLIPPYSPTNKCAAFPTASTLASALTYGMV